jgi:uncharacterized membrane protein
LTASKVFGFTTTDAMKDVSAAIGSLLGLQLIRLESADYAVTGKTTKLRVRVNLATLTAAYAGTYTAGLYPVTAVSFSSGNPTYTVGAVISGSTAAIAAPSADSLVEADSGAFTIPADGYYVMAVALSATAPPANCGFVANAFLQVANV